MGTEGSAAADVATGGVTGEDGDRKPAAIDRSGQAEGERSHWHKVDATEIWLYHSGAPLVLSLSETESGPATEHLLTPDLTAGLPQIIVPEHHWQAARSTGAYTLVSCTVSPGFQFEGFELAPNAFDIPRAV